MILAMNACLLAKNKFHFRIGRYLQSFTSNRARTIFGNQTPQKAHDREAAKFSCDKCNFAINVDISQIHFERCLCLTKQTQNSCSIDVKNCTKAH